MAEHQAAHHLHGQATVKGSKQAPAARHLGLGALEWDHLPVLGVTGRTGPRILEVATWTMQRGARVAKVGWSRAMRICDLGCTRLAMLEVPCLAPLAPASVASRPTCL